MRFIFAALVATLFCCQPGTGATVQELGGSYDEASQCEDTCGPHGDKSLVCHYPPGNEENPQTICVGSNLVPDHLTHGDDCGECEPDGPVCGDSTCEAPENCNSCPGDCGDCPPVCGDQVCEDAENCSQCPEDCGECPPVCGDQVCEDAENCEDCACDCGPCEEPPECGNYACEDGEDCSNCPSDCGECPPVCGNESCEVGENCETCAEDCGNCPPTCGDGVCDEGEGCEACPRDCGQCTPPDAGPTQPDPDTGVSPDVTVTGGELGGCSTAGNGGVLGLLFIGGILFFMRSRSKDLRLLIVLFIMSLPGLANAQVAGDPGDFKLERLEMAMDGESIITVEGAEVGLKGAGGFHFSLGYADDPLVLQENTGDGFNRVGSLVGHQLSGSIGGYLTFTDNLAFGITLPMVLSQDRDAGDITGLSHLKRGGLSDPRFTLKYQLVEQRDRDFSLAIGANATTPREISNNDYLGGDGATLSPFVSVARKYSSWRWAMNAGVKLQADSEVVDLVISDETFARLGVAKSWGVNEIGVTVSGTSSVDAMFTENSSYSELMTSYSRQYDSGFSSFMGGGVGLNQGFGAPDWRVFAGLRLDVGAPVAKQRQRVEVVPPVETEVVPIPEPRTKLVLTVPDAFFAFDKDVVLPQYRAELEEFSQQLMQVEKDHPELEAFVILAGHTDSIGPNAYNIDLGERRSKAVMQVMLDFGVGRDKILLISHGENVPIAPNSTAEGRATNRRVEVLLGGNRGTLDYYDIIANPEVKPSDEETYDKYGDLDIK